MKKIWAFALFLIVLFACAPQRGQEIDPSLLNLERIYSSREFAPERFGPAKWLEQRSGYTTLERSRSKKHADARDIVFYDPESGEREILVSASRLIPGGQSQPLSISDYEWSSNGQKLLIFTNTERVWRQNTRGDYWVLDLSDWSLHELGGDAESSTLMFAEFSPEGDKAAYVINNNIYVEDLKTRRITQLTKDGSKTIINGTFDWVYEEEFSLRDGFRWSPDGKWIAYWQLDTEGVKSTIPIPSTRSSGPSSIPKQGRPTRPAAWAW